MKFFNTAGPVNMPEHYRIDPLHRWDLEEVLNLINQKKYFILHAPRQTGKTSSLLALQEYLNQRKEYFCLYANFEVGQASRNDLKSGIRGIVVEIANRLSIILKDRSTIHKIIDIFNESAAENGLNSVLSYISSTIDKPLVLLIDEIDSLVGDTLISVLRQLRAGYDKRPANFPSTIILCGVRDIKDYRIHTSGNDIITGGSAFNIKAVSLKLGNFSKDDVIELYSQHTLETKQKFSENCFDLIMELTDGQPWLVNALAYEATYNIRENRDSSVMITKDIIEEAKERLIISRQTHLDQLADKLSEDRVRRVILPMIIGEEAQVQKDDEQYCLDLGLIKVTENGLMISNKIYKEVIPRELTESKQRFFMSVFNPDWMNTDKSINTVRLITLFRDFWRENSEIWASHIKGYQEAAPHLVFQAFLQRVANGNGRISREYAIGRGRLDILLEWQEQRIAIEIKTISQKQKYETVKEMAIKQTSEYAEKISATEAHLLIFDRDGKMNWQNNCLSETVNYNHTEIKIWGI